LQQEMANKTIVILKSQAKLDKKGNRKKNQHNHRCNFIEQQFKNIVSDKGIAKWTKMMTMDGKNRGVCEGDAVCVVSALSGTQWIEILQIHNSKNLYRGV